MFVASSSGSAYGSTAGGTSAGGGFGLSGAGMMSLIGGGLRAYGAIQEGKAKARALKAQAAAKDVEAEEVRQQGLWDQIRANEDQRRLLSTQRQLFGQAGVTLEGAPGELMGRSEQEFVLDRMMGARNVASQVSALHFDARELRKAAKEAKRQGTIGAFSSFF